MELSLPVVDVVAADLVIRFGEIEPWPEADAGWIRGSPDGMELTIRLLTDHGAVSAAIRHGREIVVDARADPDSLRAFLLGPFLALIVHQRGWLALHASAVSIGDGAVMFAGEQGAGKTTLCGAMHTRGHPIVSDDVLAVAVSGVGSSFVLPGVPILKLLPDSAEILEHARGCVPADPLLRGKRVYVPRGEVIQRVLPASRVYILADGLSIGVKVLGPREAFAALARHVHPSVIGVPSNGGSAARLLHQCTSVARTASVRILSRPRSLASLDVLCEMIESDVASPVSAGTRTE